jgi:hypothetical protein
LGHGLTQSSLGIGVGAGFGSGSVSGSGLKTYSAAGSFARQNKSDQDSEPISLKCLNPDGIRPLAGRPLSPALVCGVDNKSSLVYKLPIRSRLISRTASVRLSMFLPLRLLSCLKCNTAVVVDFVFGNWNNESINIMSHSSVPRFFVRFYCFKVHSALSLPRRRAGTCEARRRLPYEFWQICVSVRLKQAAMSARFEPS